MRGLFCKFRKQQNPGHAPLQKVSSSVIKKVELRSTYRYFKIFQVEGIIFGYPIILHISVGANKDPLRKWIIRPNFTVNTEGPGNQSGTSSGSPPFKEEIKIPPLEPNECKKIKIKTDAIRIIPRVTNPSSLELDVFDSEGQHQRGERVYPHLKNVEKAKEEGRNKAIFGVVILTFLLTIVSLFVSLSGGK